MRLIAGGFPWLQRRLQRRLPLIIFSLAILANGVSITNVFPYGPAMCLHLGLTKDKRELGFYAGFLMATYQLGQMLSSFPLGQLADRPTFGRKRVILLGLASCTLPQVVFGMSPSFGFALTARFLMGLPNGTVLAAKAMAPDLVPAHEHGLAMSLIAGMWGLGNIMGPALGGLLSETGPPGSIFGAHPYLLPNLVCALIAMGSLIAVHRFLPEAQLGLASSDQARSSDIDRSQQSQLELASSDQARPMEPPMDAPIESTPARALPAEDAPVPATPPMTPPAASMEGARHGGDDAPTLADRSIDTLASPEGSATMAERSSAALKPRRRAAASPWRIGKAVSSMVPRRARPPLILYSLVAGCCIMFDEVLPLWCVAPESSGGLGFNTTENGVLLTIAGAALMFFQLFGLPWLSARVSHDRLFKQSTFVASGAYVLLPMVANAPAAARWPLLLTLIVLVRCVQGASFVAIFVMINNSVLPGERGRVQGLAMAGAAAMRAICPVLGASLFAWSLTNKLSVPGLDVYFIFLISGLASVATAAAAVRHLPPEYNIELSKLQSHGVPHGNAS